MKLVKTWWLPDREEHLADWIIRCDNYQTPHRANALSHVKKWGVAVDIGAHVGLWSREFSEKFSHVHAFEPVEEHRACYVANLAGRTNYTLHPCALGEKEGSVKMVVVEHSTGGTHVDPKETGDIPLRTLDSFNLHVDFVKMDCEAYELFVLRGAKETLLRCKPIVCLEQKNQGYFGHPRYAASEYLRELGAKALSHFKDDWVFGWPDRLHDGGAVG